MRCGVNEPREVLEPRVVGNVKHGIDAAAARHARKADAVVGVAALHARLGVAAVVEDRDREVRRARDADRRKPTQPHQHLAVTGHDEDSPLGLRQREAEPDHRGRAHRAPEIKIAGVIADRGGVPRRRAEPGHEQEAVAVLQQHAHRLAAIQPQLIDSLPVDALTHAVEFSSSGRGPV